MTTKHRLAILVPLIAVSTGCDQATKQIASSSLRSAPTQSFFGDTFRLQYSENPGAFLSLGAGLSDDARAVVFLIGVGLLLAAMLVFALTSRRLTPPMVAALALFLGGGFSNWADRVAHGNVVVDFMNVGVGVVRTGIFNVADMFVMSGAALFALSVLLPTRAAAPVAPSGVEEAAEPPLAAGEESKGGAREAPEESPSEGDQWPR